MKTLCVSQRLIGSLRTLPTGAMCRGLHGHVWQGSFSVLLGDLWTILECLRWPLLFSRPENISFSLENLIPCAPVSACPHCWNASAQVRSLQLPLYPWDAGSSFDMSVSPRRFTAHRTGACFCPAPLTIAHKLHKLCSEEAHARYKFPFPALRQEDACDVLYGLHSVTLFWHVWLWSNVRFSCLAPSSYKNPLSS